MDVPCARTWSASSASAKRFHVKKKRNTRWWKWIDATWRKGCRRSTWTAFSYFCLRKSPTWPNEGIVRQHVFSSHEPETPWQRHCIRINVAMAFFFKTNKQTNKNQNQYTIASKDRNESIANPKKNQTVAFVSEDHKIVALAATGWRCLCLFSKLPQVSPKFDNR